MNKSAFKKPLKIAGYTLAAFVGLLLIITLIINFGPVQDKIVSKATQALQEKIPTKVHIDKIQVNLISQAVSLHGVEVEDLQHRKMLQLEEISADLKFLPLFMGKIILKGGEANGLKALIVKPSKEEPANYQFLIDAFKKKDDKGEKKEKKKNSAKRFAVDLSHLQIYDINVKYNDYDIQLERGSYTKELSGNQFVILQDGQAKWDATTKKGREARTVGIGLLSAVLTDTGEKLVTLRDFKYQTNNHKPRKNAHKPKRGFFDMGHLDITADLKVTLNHISKDSINATITKGFAYDLCVVSGDVSGNSLDLPNSHTALLCGIEDKQVYYSKNSLETLDPASLTKVLTAILAIEHGNPSDILTAGSDVNIDENGATTVGIEEGDTMTLDQALNALLLPSGNDAAVLIADYVAGSQEAFADMMNEKARSLGATGCHFVNPHGLTASDHYITAYDMYLIFNEAIKHEEFLRIISSTEYSSVYHDRVGNPKELSFKNTNQFINGNHPSPDGISVIGGKTGTTKAAKSCLILLSNGSNGHTYISVILGSTDHDSLYRNMTTLLTDIN